MSKTIAIVIALVILASLGYYFFLDASAPAAPQTATTTSSGSETPPAQDQAMIGTWRSTDDSKFTRAFAPDGTVVDAYEGEPSATERGTFRAVTPASDPNYPAQAADFPGLTVIRIDFEKSGAMYFAINKLDSASLEMTYLDRGNLLSFVRVQ